MRVVGLKVLKNKLSEYVRAATAGETILVADREEIVAELVPPRPSRAPRVADAVLADLVRRGLASPPLFPAGPLPPLPEGGPRVPIGQLLADLDRDRGDR